MRRSLSCCSFSFIIKSVASIFIICSSFHNWYIIDSRLGKCTLFLVSWWFSGIWLLQLTTCIFLLFFHFWLSRDIPGQDRTGCQNLVQARPVPKCQNSIPARSIARFWACPMVPLSRNNEKTSVSFSLLISTGFLKYPLELKKNFS